MEEFSATEKAMTEEFNQLKVDLCRKVAARSSREEELVWLREELAWLGEELGKKGSGMLKKDSDLQQKESALLVLSEHLKRRDSVQRGRSYPEVRVKHF